MNRLHTFGTLRIEVDGQPAGGPGAQRHRLALLALLAATPGHQLSRDRVLAMLWPERSSPHGRTLLNTTIHALRRALGEDTIRSIVDDVFLDPAHLSCDVIAFEQLSRDGSDDEAAGLYAGPFLDGFHLPGSETFEEWLAGTRERLAAAQSRVLERLAVSAEARGDHAAAVERWRALTQHAPLSQRGTEGLVRALAAAGDRSAALAAGERFALRVRDTLGIEPDISLGRLLASLRTSSPTHPAAAPPVLHPGPDAGDASVAAGASPRPAPARRMRRDRLALVAVALFGLIFVAWVQLAARGPATAPRERLLVMPFTVEGSDSAAWLREGMVDLLAARFEGLPGPGVIRPRQLIQTWSRNAPGDAAAMRAAALDAAREAGASRVLLGTIVDTAGQLAVTGTLVDARSPRRTRRLPTVAGPADSLTALVDRLATLVLGPGGVRRMRPAAVRGGARDIAALRWYVQGQADYRRGAWARAADAFDSAITMDTGWAQAALGLALAENFGGNEARWNRAMDVLDRQRGQLSRAEYLTWDAMIGRALPRRLSAWREVTVLLPDDPEGWYELGDLDYHWGTQFGSAERWQAARANFERALAADPGFSPALSHLVELLAGTGARDTLPPLAERWFALVGEAERTRTALGWLTAITLGDSARLDSSRAAFASFSPLELRRVARLAQAFGVGLADADAALRVYTARTTGDAWRDAMITRWVFESNVGHPGRADSLLGVLLSRYPERPGLRELAVLSYLYGEGSRGRAEASMRDIRRVRDDRRASATDRWRAACTVAWWDGFHGRFGEINTTADSLMAPVLVPRREAREFGADNEVCARTLRAFVEGGRGDGSALDALDAYLAASGVSRMRSEAAALEAVRLMVDRTEVARAAAVTRRRQHLQQEPFLLAAQLVRRAQLAARAGDTVAAREAWRHYLALRLDPEPGVARQATERAAREFSALP